MTNNKWLEPLRYVNFSSMNNKVAMKASGVSQLATFSSTPSVSSAILGDYTKWCSALLWFPVDFIGDSTEAELVVGASKTGASAYDISVNKEFGYTLGEYYCTPIYSSFLDYEPYTSIRAYLPFYGYIDIPTVEVVGKYIQFRIRFDMQTGQAVYYIGVSDSSVTSPNSPLWLGTDDSNTRILSVISFNIASNIPLGQTGVNEIVRNIGISSLKASTSIASNIVALSSNLGTISGTTKTIKTGVNKKGEPIVTSTKTEVRETDTSVYRKRDIINESFNVASDAISSCHFNAKIDSVNNPIADSSSPKSVMIVRKTVKCKTPSTVFGSLYGYPLGETRQLSELSGFTQISDVHVEGAGFKTATQKELLAIEEELSNGIIL